MSADPPRSFVDTNVLLYAFDTSARAKRARALDLVRDLWGTGTGCVSVQVLQEFYVNATRKLPNPLTTDTAKRIVVSLSRWDVHAPDAEDVIAAIDLQRIAQLSFWDAMIVYSAGRLGCDLLYSEDLNHGQVIAGTEILDPFSANAGSR